MEGTPDYYHYIGEELGANHNNRSIDPSPTHVLPVSANKPVVSFPLAEGGICGVFPPYACHQRNLCGAFQSVCGLC